MAARKNSPFDNRALIRLATWGTGAAVALAVAGLTTLSTTGSQRIALAATTWTGDGAPGQVTVAQVTETRNVEAETRRLNEAIRLLAADRDRLITRVASLEHNVDDMTGSIKRQAQQPPLPSIPQAEPEAKTTASLPAIPAAAPEATTSAGAETAAANDTPEWLADQFKAWPSAAVAFEMAPMPEPEIQTGSVPLSSASPQAQPDAVRAEFAVDIGHGSNLEQVRTLWRALRTKHARLFAGLRPIIALREDHPGTIDIRLLVGPLANAGEAARLCGYLIAAKVRCSTQPFDGQQLAER